MLQISIALLLLTKIMSSNAEERKQKDDSFLATRDSQTQVRKKATSKWPRLVDDTSVESLTGGTMVSVAQNDVLFILITDYIKRNLGRSLRQPSP